jgi:hypothetical protein
MISVVLRDSTLESLTTSVNAPLVKNMTFSVQMFLASSFFFIFGVKKVLYI